jgi:hypothetical protein
MVIAMERSRAMAAGWKPADRPAGMPALRTLFVLVLMLTASVSSQAATFKFFGSAGAESQLTPPNEASSLNPHNVADIPYHTNVGDLAAFGEAVGKDRGWKVHIKVRGSASDRAADRAQVGEAYLQLDPKPWLDVTIGRVIEKWGTGYAWNPTAFISPIKNPTDPNDRLSAYRGLDMLKTDLFLGKTNVSLYAMQHDVFAARVYRLIANTDVSLNVRHDRGVAQEGLSMARVFGDAFELHGEVAYHSGAASDAPGGTTAAPTHSYASALLGAQYTFRHDVNAVFELYHGGDGLSAAEWQTFLALARFDLRAANGQFIPLRMARDYSFLRVEVPFESGKDDVELIAITSLRDRSTIARLTLTRKVTPRISAYLIDSEFLGARNTELSLIQIRRSTVLGFRVYF